MGFFDRLKEGLRKTKESIFGQVSTIFKHFTKVDEEMLEELEEVLIASDLGVHVTETVIETLRDHIKEKHITEPEQARLELISILEEITGENEGLKIDTRPSVIFVIGVNGVGKTTSIAKLAHHLKSQGKTVALAAADTFRAAAIDQLEIWAERVKVPIIKHTEGSDPAAVTFDAIAAAKARKADVLIIDTAGRLHTKSNLMEELKKIKRVSEREVAGAPHETLLVLDATTGQNALNQAKIFGQTSEITGLVLTKLDGTAKGGVVIAIKSELDIPVKWIGVGEGVNDLRPFVAKDFVEALFHSEK